MVFLVTKEDENFYTYAKKNGIGHYSENDKGLLRYLSKQEVVAFDASYLFKTLPKLIDLQILYYIFRNQVNPTISCLGEAVKINHRDIVSRINSIFKVHGKRWDFVPQSFRMKYMLYELNILEKYYNSIKPSIDSPIMEFHSRFKRTATILRQIEEKGFKVKKDLSSLRHIKFVDSLLNSANRKGIVHPKFNLFASRNGRIQSASGFNVMAIPKSKGIRYGICSRWGREGRIVVVDFKTFQFSIALSLAGVEIEGDPYKEISKDFGISRESAKVIALSLLFGARPSSVAERTGVSESKIKILLKEYKLEKIIEETIEFAKENGYIRNSFGRIRRFNKEDFNSLETKAFNSLMQCYEVDILTEALCNIQTNLPNKATIIFPQHDALVLDVHNSMLGISMDVIDANILKVDNELFRKNLKYIIKSGETFGVVSGRTGM